MAECDGTGRELSFEWSHQTILSTDSKVRLILPNSTKHSGSERVKGLTLYDGYVTFIGKVWCSRITCIFITFFFYQYINRYTSNRKEFFIQTTILQIKTYRAVTKISNCQVQQVYNEENQNCQAFLLVLFFLLFSHQSSQGKIMTPASYVSPYPTSTTENRKHCCLNNIYWQK